VNEQAIDTARPTVLLLGEASARPGGLERALTRAGFRLVEPEDPSGHPPADAILISVTDENHLTQLLSSELGLGPALSPRIVLISDANPDAPARALAMGAADALVAPVHFPELCARLHARIREHREPVRSSAGNGKEPAGGTRGEAPDQDTEALEGRVKEEFERARRYSLSFSLILLGIDELQGVDERLGSDTAGRLRSEVRRTLRSELRMPDLVVSYGSDEFAILLPETGQAGARQSVIRMRERLTSLPFEGDPRLEGSRFSAGIVTFPHPAANRPDDLFAMAEAALMRGRAQSMERIGVAL
jgi:diguanylate cyclase (GGDEF)-like protein